LEGVVRVSIVATGIDYSSLASSKPDESHSTIAIDNSVYQQKAFKEELISSNNETETYNEVNHLQVIND
jgi:hypothetical protein